jgi:hypothetical protein
LGAHTQKGHPPRRMAFPMVGVRARPGLVYLKEAMALASSS